MKLETQSLYCNSQESYTDRKDHSIKFTFRLTLLWIGSYSRIISTASMNHFASIALDRISDELFNLKRHHH